jgi:hypothetical protein
MLAALLDPDGPHRQGSKFLTLFLRLIVGRNETDAWLDSHWQVEVERKISRGQLDILLTCQDRGLRIVIENKIDALEGERQLDRYLQWMDQECTAFPRQMLVFLTIEGSAPVSANTARVRPLSYADILQILTDGTRNVNSTPFASVLQQYLHVLKGIVPDEACASAPAIRVGRILMPSANIQAPVVGFLRDLHQRWDQLPMSGRARPTVLGSLVPLPPDAGGKWPGLEIWVRDFLGLMSQQIVIIRVEASLASRGVVGLWVGLHWRNTRVRDKNEKWLALPEAQELLGYLTKFCRVRPEHIIGQWIGIAERLEYPRSDAALVSLLRHHAADVQRAIVSAICNVWVLCGDKLVALNRRLIALQR